MRFVTICALFLYKLLVFSCVFVLSSYYLRPVFRKCWTFLCFCNRTKVFLFLFGEIWRKMVLFYFPSSCSYLFPLFLFFARIRRQNELQWERTVGMLVGIILRITKKTVVLWGRSKQIYLTNHSYESIWLLWGLYFCNKIKQKRWEHIWMQLCANMNNDKYKASDTDCTKKFVVRWKVSYFSRWQCLVGELVLYYFFYGFSKRSFEIIVNW